MERAEVHLPLDIATRVQRMKGEKFIAAVQGPTAAEVTLAARESAQGSHQGSGVTRLGRERRKRICDVSWSAEDKRLPKAVCLALQPAQKKRRER